MPESLLPAKDALDHLLLGVPDLEDGMAWVAEKTGVQAALGGRHPGLGTRNALLSLGQKQYLEIIAPDPTQTTLAPQFAFLQLATTPRLLTWAAATKDIHATAAQAHAAGFELSGPHAGSRTRTDGQTLTWKTLFLKNDFRLLVPFFIEWDAASRHPSEDSPTGCTLQSFTLASPQPEPLRAAFRHLGIAVNVARSNEARLHAVLHTPNGKLELI